MTTSVTAGGLTVYLSEGPDNAKTYVTSSGSTGLQASLTTLVNAFSTATGHDHDGVDSKPIPNGSLNLSWSSWTPTLTQTIGVNVTIGHAKYMALGKVALVNMLVTATSTGQAGRDIVVGGIPSAIAIVQTAYQVCLGQFTGYDTGTNIYAGSVHGGTSNTVSFRSDANNGALGAAPAWQLANTDTISFTASWEIA
jgi:hypothetical protein